VLLAPVLLALLVLLVLPALPVAALPPLSKRACGADDVSPRAASGCAGCWWGMATGGRG
jgi:hypothetical protein